MFSTLGSASAGQNAIHWRDGKDASLSHPSTRPASNLVSQFISLVTGEAHSSWESLPETQMSELRGRLGAPLMASLEALSHFTQVPPLFRAWAGLAEREWSRGSAETAGALTYLALSHLEAHPDLAGQVSAKTRSRLEGLREQLEGRGTLGQRVTHFLDQTARELASPLPWASFAAGIGTFQLVRGGLTSWIYKNSAAKSLPWLIGARTSTNLAAVAAESMAFSLTSRGMAHYFHGPQNWEASHVARDIFSNGLLFGYLRGAGGLTRGILTRTQATGLPSVLLPQASMMAGIGMAHRTGSAFNLHEEKAGWELGIHTLTTWIHFTLAGKMFEAVQPLRFRTWTHEMEGLSQRRWAQALGAARARFQSSGGWGWPQTASVVSGGEVLNSGRSGEVRRFPNLMMMSKDGGKLPPAPGLPTGVGDRRGMTSIMRVKSTMEEQAEALEHAPQPIFITDGGGNIVFLNQQARKIFGREGQTLQGLNVSEVMHPERGEELIYRPSNAEFQDRSYEHSQHALVGEGRYTAHYFREVTSFRRLQLENAIGQELRRLHHDAMGMLMSLDFYLNYSHGPIGEVLRKLASEGGIIGENVERIIMGHNNLGPAIRGITQILPAARAISIGERKSDTTYELPAVLEQAIQAQEPSRENLKIPFEARIEQGLIVKGNPAFMMASVTNLIRNAFEAMGSRGGELLLVAERRQGGIVIEVTDTGPGIPAAILPRIFEEKFTTKNSGTGIGLFNVREFIEKHHGGRVEAQSQVGQGTTFRIHLPDARKSDSAT